MKYHRKLFAIATVIYVSVTSSYSLAQDGEADASAADVQKESELLSEIRQLTFEGRRAGEGYFSRDGRSLVFQSERESGNPFFQIYLMDFELGDVQRISPGHGKTTCAWIHPSGQQVLFASTHDDPQARDKQQEEFELRAAGKQRRYSWDYDEYFDLYQYDRQAKQYTNLTKVRGYDAEGSFSPDGEWIAFASNRRGYTETLSAEDQKAFERDRAYMMDIYLMNADGSDVRRLTDVPGYDGGPFFSPDGRRICWRRFSADGALAEIMTMNTDGSDQRQITRLGAMSWAPYYHPSGEYLIFTTNRHGFENFELYLVDAQGKSTPRRVTHTPGFDGLPAFSPDGKQLSWTANRTAQKQSQIFIAQWNHERARRLLGLSDQSKQVAQAAEDQPQPVQAAAEVARQSISEYSPQDILRHVDYLCRPELEGRLTGTRGEKMATSYVASFFDSLGLQPAGDDGGYFQEFQVTSGVALGEDNQLVRGDTVYELDEQWRPMAFSATGSIEKSPVVFAGYGIAAPEEDVHAEYDSYVHLDVKDKWVVVLRYMPEDISPEYRQHLSRHSSLRFKSMLARDKGARGLVVVSGPNAKVKSQLIKLRFDGTLSGSSIPVISVTDEIVSQWLTTADKDFQKLHDALDTGEPFMGFPLPGVELAAHIDIEKITQIGRNVLAVLPVTASPVAGSPAAVRPAAECVIVGAHIDHLGRGNAASSLARDDEASQIHFGADDNASGVAAMLEVAQHLAHLQSEGRLEAKRDLLFAAWSGEELGLLGSSHFIKQLAHASAHSSSGEAASQPGSIYPRISACLNMDMVGRLDKRLILQGIGSSNIWAAEIERRNAPIGLPIALQNDSYIPTDASAFFMQGVPILSAFTGAHSEYHTPRDTPDRLNYDGAAKVARLMGLIARSVARRDTAPDYVAQQDVKERPRARLRAYLGSIPDYAESDLKGVKLSGVTKNGPADKAGVRGGDVIVELAGRKIENIYDYTYAIEALKIGQEVPIVVERAGKRKSLKVVPGSRE